MLCYTLRLSYGFCTASRGCFLFVAEPVKRDFRFCKLTRSLHHAACGLYTGKGGEVGGPNLPPPEPCIPSFRFFSWLLFPFGEILSIIEYLPPISPAYNPCRTPCSRHFLSLLTYPSYPLCPLSRTPLSSPYMYSRCF